MYLDIGLEFNSAKDSAPLEVQNLYTVLSNAFCDFHCIWFLVRNVCSICIPHFCLLYHLLRHNTMPFYILDLAVLCKYRWAQVDCNSFAKLKRSIRFSNVMGETIIFWTNSFMCPSWREFEKQFVDCSQAIHFCTPCERIRQTFLLCRSCKTGSLVMISVQLKVEIG